MKTLTRPERNRAGPLAACLAMSLLGLTAAQAATRRVVLPPGSVIPVRLDQSLSSKTAQSGDRFTATVRYGQDDAGLPEGTRVEGVMREVLPAADGKPGVLDMDFRRMVTPGGQTRTITGSLVALDAKSVQRSESGRLVASTDKGKDRLKWIGIGAGAGLLAGVLTKGNKLVDTLLGAGAGYLYNEFGNKPKPGDVNLKSGTEFGIRLDRQLTFDTNRTDDYNTSGITPSGTSGTVRNAVIPTQGDGAVGSGEDIGMLIDDRDVSFGSAKPFMRGSQVLVPLDTVSRAANFDYRYNAQQRTIRARNNTLRLGLGSRIAVLNGQRSRLPAAAEIRNGTLYVPLQFIGLATGGSTNWDSGSRTIVLTTNHPR
jgi:hypothetical protein